MFNRKGEGGNLGLEEGGGNLEGEFDPPAAEGGRKKINNGTVLLIIIPPLNDNPPGQKFGAKKIYDNPPHQIWPISTLRGGGYY